MTTLKSINEGSGFTFEGMSPGSINEPPVVPAGVYKPQITSMVPSTHAINGPDFTVTLTGTGFFKRQCASRRTRTGRRCSTPTRRCPSCSSLPGPRPGTVKVIVRNGAYPSNAMDFMFTATE